MAFGGLWVNVGVNHRRRAFRRWNSSCWRILGYRARDIPESACWTRQPSRISRTSNWQFEPIWQPGFWTSQWHLAPKPWAGESKVCYYKFHLTPTNNAEGEGMLPEISSLDYTIITIFCRHLNIFSWIYQIDEVLIQLLSWRKWVAERQCNCTLVVQALHDAFAQPSVYSV